MHTELLNMGFVKEPDGVYINRELSIKVKIIDNKITIVTKTGEVKIIAIKDLELIMADYL
jgi:hypothetical protein